MLLVCLAAFALAVPQPGVRVERESLSGPDAAAREIEYDKGRGASRDRGGSKGRESYEIGRAQGRESYEIGGRSEGRGAVRTG